MSRRLSACWLMPTLVVLAGSLLAGSLVVRGTRAAYAVPTANAANSLAAGTVSVSDDDGGTALLDLGDLKPGDTGSTCVRVAYGGSLPAELKVYASSVAGGLAPYVDVSVEDGPIGGSATCAAFDARALLYGGPAAGLPTTYASARVGAFAPVAPGTSTAYRVRYALDPAAPNSAQGASLSIALRWEARSATPRPVSGWGRNFSGQLAAGDDVDRSSPVAALGGVVDWTSVGAGAHHACATRANGWLYCWGNNLDGQAGSGDTVARATPHRVGTDDDWALVGDALGSFNSCAIKTTGTLWCWGANGDGRLGLGDTAPRTVPAQVGTDADWATVTSDGGHTCATKTTGALYCWGWNGDGQLGLGDTATRTAPVRVGTDADWAGVAAGSDHVCATKTGGALYCWGDNGSGRLGLGDTANRSAPVRVGTDGDWATLAGGGEHTCATKANGSLYCWGANATGQLGLGDTAPRSTPVRVGTDGDWAGVAASPGFTCAVRTTSALACWGTNTYGQLGLGDTAQRTSPVEVGTGYRSLALGELHALATRRPA